MKPFHGITFCPTAIQNEETSRSVSKKIIKLGGNFSKDLTKYVNVLVIGKTKNTEKYKFAVKHRADIIFINTEAIDMIYQLWLSGDDVTLENHSNFEHLKGEQQMKLRMLTVLRSRYSLPPLENFKVFIGRISQKLIFTEDDTIIRKLPSIEELTNICLSLGVASCNSNHFVKDCKSTSSAPAVFVTDNMQGARVDAAREQGLAIIHYKWLIDCARRNAMLQYDPYYLLKDVQGLPFNDIGKSVCECWNKLDNKYKSVEQDILSTAKNLESEETDFTKNNSTMLNKFKSEGNKLWNKAMSHDNLSQTGITEKLPITGNINTEPKWSNQSSSGKIFSNCSFYIHRSFSAKHQGILERVIQQNDGYVHDKPFTTIDPENSFIIIPHNIPTDKLDVGGNTNLVTEFFIERCLHYKKLLLPLDSWSKPFLLTNKFQIIPNEKLSHDYKSSLTISITGFHGVELLHLVKIFELLKPMGVTYMKYLNKTTDLLIINLSSLPSIPQEHALWQNEFSDLFREDHKSNQEKNNNQVFRNSMKKKIEFIKEDHSIPVVTPVFLMEILKKAPLLNTNTLKDVIYLNNINWCIMCPRGKKDDFTCTLVPRQEARINDSIKDLFQLNDDTGYSSIKSSKDEFLRKIKSNSPLKTTSSMKNRHFVKTDSLPFTDNLELQESPPIKRQKLSPSKSIEPVKRLASWGKLMSGTDSVEKNQEVDKALELETEVRESSTADFEYGHTQITYGASNTSSKNVKKLTRKHMKKID